MKSKELLKKIRSILSESNSINQIPATGILKKVMDSGRYDVAYHNKEDDGYRVNHDIGVLPKKPSGAADFSPRTGKPKGWYDPKISHLVLPPVDEPYGRTHPQLNPDSGYHKEIQAQKTPGVLYRGMSHEEFHNILKTGEIKSKGDYNLAGQEGLTYYSKDPAQAQNYAHGFAPVQHKATGQHHAYVVAVKDPGTNVKIAGTGEDEVGIPHAIKKSDILGVHIGRVYAAHPGEYSVHQENGKVSSGSSHDPSAFIAWKKHNIEDFQ
jgi:hypothetical protein